MASSELSTYRIREDNLVLECWHNNNVTSSLIEPPLELCSPRICSAANCRSGEFVFNARAVWRSAVFNSTAAPVPKLEDLKREDCGGEENQRERERGELHDVARLQRVSSSEVPLWERRRQALQVSCLHAAAMVAVVGPD